MSRSADHRLKDEGSKTQVVLAGATAGLIARFVIAPLDVVKIRLQLQTHPGRTIIQPHPPSTQPPLYKGTLQTLVRIFREEGLTALWKGNIPAEALYITYSAVQFTTYRLTTLGLQSLFSTHPLSPPTESFVAGATAGAVSTTVTYPLDLLRTRFAAQGTQKVYPSLWYGIRSIATNEGPAGFFRGLSAGIIQIVPYMGLFFSVYETLRPYSATLTLPFGSGDAVAGVAASVFAKTAVFPLDLVRKRLQVQGPTRRQYVVGGLAYRGVGGSMKAIVRREGWRGLYRGLTVSLVKAAPASAVTMWTYERALAFFISLDQAKEQEQEATSP
ncbi:mitochondrial thiamine pyrophosphate transporter [Pseudogymnoascus verrucosus]|uniref:Mitochondrial thiamine pyrophosphate carrier 1 n=1 Tax=Pseudogymnoascus verrucosus TaxID=342668 RepID=A0A1B8GQQ8_9PEZI|nr:mitochondrial thiamine pyrophosphate transporter [Pseudogymnoascus verrucosus]OBT98165.1 mitochondrial thiamine pyrophosphate transporter [Pseudogymnoascus verrucosus]